MTTELRRVGIIGADAKASWAGMSHVPALAGLPGIELAAVATRHEDSARAAAEAFGVAKWFGDPLRMIEDPELDIITVAVKVPAHRPLVEAALTAGKAVYSEAPLGVDVAETEKLAAAAGGNLTAIGLQGRLNPSVRRAAQLIADGAIGRPLTARIYSTSGGFGPATISPYVYFEQAAAGANLLTITAGHTFDLIEAVLGDVVEVEARLATLFPRIPVADTGETVRREVPDQIDALGSTASGALITVSVAGGIAPEEADFRFDVRGTDGWLSLRGGTVFGVQGGDLTLSASVDFEPPAQPALATAGPALNVAEVYASLLADLDHGTRHTPGFQAALHNARLIARIAG